MPSSAIRPPFPTAIDNTMRVAYRDCPAKFYWSFIRKLARRQESVHLHAGKAYALGLETYRRAIYCDEAGKGVALARGVSAILRAYGDFDPQGHAKSAWGMVGALEHYSNKWLPGTDFLEPCLIGDQRAIEYSFSIPLEDCPHPETGEPILYTGRNDMLAQRGSMLYVLDDKTTTSLGPTYPLRWKIHSQPTGYAWAARHDGFPAVGAIIRAVAIKKGGYDSIEIVLAKSGWELDRWRKQLSRDIHGMVRSWEEGEWDYDLGGACSQYGGCPFMDLCVSNQPERWTGNYVKRTWDPIFGD